MGVLESLIGWVIFLTILGLVSGIAWWQWNTYVTLDRRIEERDETLLHSAGLRVESVVDAPQGSVIVPYIPVEETMPSQSVVPISDAPIIE
jgi:hypothetical protein